MQMKRQIFLFLVFFCFLFSMFPSNYIPMVKESNRWNAVTGGYGSRMKIYGISNTCYKMEGDTSIQSVTYKRVLASTDSLNQSWTTYGYLREDTLQKKVWLRKDDQEGLIYHFDVQLDDTFSIFNPIVRRISTYRVVGIDSILFQTGYRKTYSMLVGNEVAQMDKDYWIEGIGSDLGPFRSGTWQLVGGFSRMLCFSDNEIEYVNPKFQTCRKTSFTPKITSLVLDTAICDQEYRFQLTTSEVFDCDSITFFFGLGSSSGGFTPYSFDGKTGLISDVFKYPGTYSLIFSLSNNGITTDLIETQLVVVNSTAVQNTHSDKAVQFMMSPSGDELTVTSDSPITTIQVVIYDMTGKALLSKYLDNPSERIGTGRLPAGMYTISVYDRKTGKKLVTEKWVKK